MRIIIAGAGAVGTHLAKMLADERHDIVLMDPEEERLANLESNFDLMTIVARPTSINSLKDVGVAGADLFVAVTPEESINITSCILAHSLGAKKTVARIDNYEYLQVLRIIEQGGTVYRRQAGNFRGFEMRGSPCASLLLCCLCRWFGCPVICC